MESGSTILARGFILDRNDKAVYTEGSLIRYNHNLSGMIHSGYNPFKNTETFSFTKENVVTIIHNLNYIRIPYMGIMSFFDKNEVIKNFNIDFSKLPVITSDGKEYIPAEPVNIRLLELNHDNS